MKDVKSLDSSFAVRGENMTVDIRYADDTMLISMTLKKLKIVTEELKNACKK